MPRQTVKLLLLDEDDRLLLIHARRSGATCWYPVGGGIEPGESLQQAAARETYEETGLRDLPAGTHVWWRDHTYEHDGRRYDVHEEWLLHRVNHFTPAPAELTPSEARTILTFRWWQARELESTQDTIFPPNLGRLLTTLLTEGVPATPTELHL
ncbi:NUDIX hydrolase [Kribbella sp.]|uniref:NUDIX hydrolase n=1 Tax=Kribbella sp. TaxID=1871183 RepID=UPI002D4D3EB6|nr:NUDIX domain-containing protein [Kribbella sp.]HZX08876.1 NUDIX domain-containing protein [Kribbella sp.]